MRADRDLVRRFIQRVRAQQRLRARERGRAVAAALIVFGERDARVVQQVAPADNVAGVSAIVEQNAAAAGEMQATTGAVTQAVGPVAAAAEQQSSAAEEVSASAAELAAQTNEIALTARHVRAQAEALAKLVSRFTIDDGQDASRASRTDTAAVRA